jgi:hypothetical protein
MRQADRDVQTMIGMGKEIKALKAERDALRSELGKVSTSPHTGARTGTEHAARIMAVIAEAEADGFEVWIRNDCCGCSNMDLVISVADQDDTAVVIPIYGEDES